MPQKGKRNADDQLIQHLACGASVEMAARQAGISVSTAYRRLANPVFVAKLRKARAEIVLRSASILSAASLESAKTLISLQSPTTPPAVRLGAARASLELGLKLREAAEVEERLAELERRADEDRARRRKY